MRLVDIHSHILPGVDDGAHNAEVSVKILEMMKEQGITDVLATPHFDASQCSIEEFNADIESAVKTLSDFTYGRELPEVYVGCEVYYFPGISKSSGIKQLTLNGSKFLLLELCYGQAITDRVLNEIIDVYNKFGIVPIIAHIERYHKEKGFKRLLDLIRHRVCIAQINSASLMDKQPYKKICLKLLKQGYISFIATDAHSVKLRPPLMDKALEAVKNNLGQDYVDMLLKNSNDFYKSAIMK